MKEPMEILEHAKQYTKDNLYDLAKELKEMHDTAVVPENGCLFKLRELVTPLTHGGQLRLAVELIHDALLENFLGL